MIGFFIVLGMRRRNALQLKLGVRRPVCGKFILSAIPNDCLRVALMNAVFALRGTVAASCSQVYQIGLQKTKELFIL